MTILCVDDDSTVLSTRKLVLQTAGFGVIVANSGPEAIDIFDHHSVDGVILDYAMPEMDGAAVAAEFKRRNPEMPILMLSAYMFLPAHALQHVDAYVTKSDGPVVMLATLHALLRNRRKELLSAAS